MLCKNSTPAEDLLWDKLRGKQLGVKFYRQKPILFEYLGHKRSFFADFYCAKIKLVVEIDGGIHLHQKEYDEYRAFIINQLGYSVVRFNNTEIENSMDAVLNKLRNIIEHSTFPLLHGGGEGVRG